MHPSVSYENQCEAHSGIATVKAGEENLTAGNSSWFDCPNCLTWFSPLCYIPFTHSALKRFFRSKNFTATTSGTKYLNSLLQADSTKMGTVWLSQQPCFCWQPRGPHSVHITWCKFSRTGLTQGGQTNALILPKYLVHYTCKTLPSFWAVILYSAIKLFFLLEEHDRWIHSLMTLERNDT